MTGSKRGPTMSGVKQHESQRAVDDPEHPDWVPPPYPTSLEGVDLSLIHRLKAMTPTERLRDLVHLSEQMRRLRDESRPL